MKPEVLKDASLVVEVCSDLYEAGRRCDGHPYIAEAFYVMATTPDGRRWRHEMSWPSVVQQTCDETGEQSFLNMREQAEASARRLADRVRIAVSAGSGIDLTRWRHDQPAYASDAYISEGIEQQRWLAEREDEDRWMSMRP